MHNFEKNSQKPEDAIMSAEDYAKITHNTPYIYEVKGDDAKLLYFGAPHTYDPESDLFDKIESRFGEFQPDLVLIEGINSEALQDPATIEMIKASSREMAIRTAGESGFSARLAAQNGTALESPEPPLREQIKFLLEQGYSRELIFTHYYYRQAAQYHKMKRELPLEEDLPRSMRDFADAAEWEDFDFSLHHLEEIGREVWPDNFRLADPTKADERTDPIPWGNTKDEQTIVNKISTAESLFRDRHIIGQLEQHAKTKKKIFIVYGASHAVMQEPAIRQLLETKS